MNENPSSEVKVLINEAPFTEDNGAIKVIQAKAKASLRIRLHSNFFSPYNRIFQTKSQKWSPFTALR